MTKAQREKNERLMLKSMIDKNPKLKTFLDTLIDMEQGVEGETSELKEMLTPLIEAQLQTAQARGVYMGWNAFAMGALAKIDKCSTVEEVKAILYEEACLARERLGLPREQTEGDGEANE